MKSEGWQVSMPASVDIAASIHRGYKIILLFLQMLMLSAQIHTYHTFKDLNKVVFAFLAYIFCTG